MVAGSWFTSKQQPIFLPGLGLAWARQDVTF